MEGPNKKEIDKTQTDKLYCFTLSKQYRQNFDGRLKRLTVLCAFESTTDTNNIWTGELRMIKIFLLDANYCQWCLLWVDPPPPPQFIKIPIHLSNTNPELYNIESDPK